MKGYAEEPQEAKVRRIARTLQFEMTKLPPISFDASGPCYDLDYEGGDGSKVRLRLATKHSERENILIGFLPLSARWRCHDAGTVTQNVPQACPCCRRCD
jgi:hypothetical protein